METELVQLVLSHLVESRLILIPFLMVIGYVIKNTNLVRDELIPVILIVLGVVSSVAMGGFSVDNVIQGVLASGGAILFHETVKEIRKIQK